MQVVLMFSDRDVILSFVGSSIINDILFEFVDALTFYFVY